MKLKYTYFLLLTYMCVVLLSCKIRNQEKYYAKAVQSYRPFDVIIVPGVPFEGENWSEIMKMRVYWAKYLWDNGMTKNIIFSGGAVYTKYSECKIMKLYAIELGIPAEHIFLDSLAEHSTENVFYSSIIARENSFKSIALTSDPFQTKLLKTFVKKINRRRDLDIQLLPAIMDTIASMNKQDFIIEHQKAIGTNFIDIENSQSKLYRLGGTIGLHINWDYKK